MRRIVRGFLWLIKSVLLAIALAAMVVSISSFWQWGWIKISRITLTSDQVEERKFIFNYEDGRIGVWEGRRLLTGEFMDYGRKMAEANGMGWQSKAGFITSEFAPSRWDHSFGPFRWSFFVGKAPHDAGQIHSLSIPCWFVALLAGAWPLISLVLWNRRQRRRRLIRFQGCCAICGYDLRATPEPGGALLSRCPECGEACKSK